MGKQAIIVEEPQMIVDQDEIADMMPTMVNAVLHVQDMPGLLEKLMAVIMAGFDNFAVLNAQELRAVIIMA